MHINRTVHHLLQGAGRVFDLQPNSQSRLSSIRPYPNDQAVLQRDWARIGQDFWNVINREPHPNHS